MDKRIYMPREINADGRMKNPGYRIVCLSMGPRELQTTRETFSTAAKCWQWIEASEEADWTWGNTHPFPGYGKNWEHFD